MKIQSLLLIFLIFSTFSFSDTSQDELLKRVSFGNSLCEKITFRTTPERNCLNDVLARIAKMDIYKMTLEICSGHNHAVSSARMVDCFQYAASRIKWQPLLDKIELCRYRNSTYSAEAICAYQAFLAVHQQLQKIKSQGSATK